MLNYEVDPAILAPRLPAGCELDSWRDRCFASVVGFQFRKTRLRGIAVPFHRNFEEVNLRFYVRHEADEGWRRGVVFVRELVPRRMIAWVANSVYGESYRALPMRHDIAVDGGVASSHHAAYEWHRGDRWERVGATFSGEPALPAAESEEAFITEHYWGYAGRRGKPTVEYRVEHPRWRVWRAERATLDCDAASLYGQEFRDPLSRSPSSAFVADGSAVVVRRGRRVG